MRVGLVGVGHMGLGMARNILRKKAATMSVCVYDVSHSNLEALGAAPGLHVASSVSDLTSRCDVIALSLPSQTAQDAVLFGPGGVTEAVEKDERFEPLTIVDHGTFSHAFALSTHATLARHGIAYVDAPVSGGPAGAEAGSLTVMLGCSQGQLSLLRPLLNMYASKLTRFGATGSGMAAKIINQLLVGVHAQAACEALALAEKMSLEVPLLQEMLASSWGQSRVLELVLADYQRLRREGNGWKGMDGPTGAPLRNLDKDFSCVLEAAAGGATLPCVEITAKAISEACRSPRMDGPFASLIENLRPRPAAPSGK